MTTNKHTVEAHARLIAAAPDLLAACEQATPILDAHINDIVGVDVYALAELRETLKTAIAKAKGQTP